MALYNPDNNPQTAQSVNVVIRAGDITRKRKAFEKFKALAEQEGYIVTGEYITTSHKIEMISPCGYVFSMAPEKFKKGHRFRIGTHTPIRARVYKSSMSEVVSKAKSKFYEEAISRGYTIVGDYINAKTKVELICPAGCTYMAMPSDFTKKARRNGCPCQSKNGYRQSSSGTFYLVRWSYGEDSFLKFGITNHSVDTRLSQQANETEYTPEVLMTMQGIEGSLPVLIERRIKTTLTTGIVSREIFGDGFTETLEDTPNNVEYVEKLIIEVLSTKEI